MGDVHTRIEISNLKDEVKRLTLKLEQSNACLGVAYGRIQDLVRQLESQQQHDPVEEVEEDDEDDTQKLYLPPHQDDNNKRTLVL